MVVGLHPRRDVARETALPGFMESDGAEVSMGGEVPDRSSLLGPPAFDSSRHPQSEAAGRQSGIVDGMAEARVNDALAGDAADEAALDFGYAAQASTMPDAPKLIDSVHLRPDLGQAVMRGAALRGDSGSANPEGDLGAANLRLSDAPTGMRIAATETASVTGGSSPVPVAGSPTLSVLPTLALPLSTDGPAAAERQAGAWQQVVGQRLSHMVAQGAREAQIQLDPPELGKLGVRVSLIGDEASVQFTSQHAAVRDLLESNVPRLRELLADEGLNLTDVGVGAEQNQAGEESMAGDERLTPGERSSGNDTGRTELAEPSQNDRRQIPASDAVVDYYA